MRFEGISCDECRQTIPVPEFQIAVYLDIAGNVKKLEAARELEGVVVSSPGTGNEIALLDICGCHCLQKSLMRLMEKLQLTSSNGKHKLPPAQTEDADVDVGGSQ